ncbi:MAG TPA: hypothetical protein VMI55_07675 [Thermoplasmata archaeon]|nr:hypothetical protein [Thermoplasmata archaeon]
MPDDVAEEHAVALHTILVETLKQLNRAEREEAEGEGLEPSEILFLLRKGPIPMLSEAELQHAIETLVANRMADAADDRQYAWDRGRQMGRHYTITAAGKEYLLGQLEKTGRVE